MKKRIFLECRRSKCLLKPLFDCASTIFWIKLFQLLMICKEMKYNLESVWQCCLTSFKLWPREILSVVFWKNEPGTSVKPCIILYTSIRYDLLPSFFQKSKLQDFCVVCNTDSKLCTIDIDLPSL